MCLVSWSVGFIGVNGMKGMTFLEVEPVETGQLVGSQVVSWFI